MTTTYTKISVKDFSRKRKKEQKDFKQIFSKIDDIEVFDFVLYNFGAILQMSQAFFKFKLSEVDNKMTLDDLESIAKELQNKILMAMGYDPLDDDKDIDENKIFSLYIDTDNSNEKETSFLFLPHYRYILDHIILRFEDIKKSSQEDDKNG